MRKIRTAITSAVIFFITFALIYFQAFYGWDKIFSDWLCQRPSVPDKNISIIGIDDKTLQKYGPMDTWSRDISTDLVALLNQNKEQSPSVIGFDIMYIENTDAETDAAFAETCKRFGNVVTAMNFQFREQPEADSAGDIVYDRFYIDQADFPYGALKDSSSYGFANTIADEDGYVRRAMAQVDYEGKTYYSLAAQIYRDYMKNANKKAVMPKLDENNLFSFQYAYKAGGYSTYSLCDVLDGTVNPAVFKDQIVFIGAYAVGMQDSYTPAISHGQQMYGVEVQANIVDALLNGRARQDLPLFPYALAAAILAAAYYVFTRRTSVLISAAAMILLAAGSVGSVKLLYNLGYVLPVLVFPAVLMVIYVISLVREYGEELVRRQKIVNVFKQYVAPQIVEEISKKKNFQTALGGEKREIAVLFVDIRGFTSMSEKMKPEEVVEILNEYLSITTSVIFDNLGTLDKFIGDATMAVFNAPFDLEDYIYRAVKTAKEMQIKGQELARQMEERYGRSVHFGIGINSGEAVVGNIGCHVRMDYTAIGDTVNTAARLESNAQPGQILISAAVYEAVKDRITASPIGEIPLKGKANGVFVYQVDEVR